MSKVCQPVSVKWYEVLSGTTHKFLGESECVELRMGLYFVLEGIRHSVTAHFEHLFDFDVSLLDMEDVSRLVDAKDEKGLLNLYNRTYNKSLCCPPKNIIETFEKIVEAWK